MNVSTNGRTDRAWVEVNLAAVARNARTLARISAARLLPIVKANAYGLGAVAVCGALEALDPWGYGVATIAEGEELRAAGIRRPVLVLLPSRPEQFAACRAARLTPMLDTPAAIRTWTAEPGAGPFHLEIDTGMSRTGIRWDEVSLAREVLDTPLLEGCFSQFLDADRREGSLERQFARFEEACGLLPRRPAVRHMANSAAALRGTRFALDLVRPGLFLYGGAPAEWLPAPEPVIAMRARVCDVRRVAAGETVSYGGRWAAPRATTVATLPIGYADGLTRDLATGGAAASIGGRACPVVGVVTMDFLMVDAGSGPVEVGDVATLIGTDGATQVTLAGFAKAAGVIPYQVLTALGSRLPRLYA